MRYCEAQTVEKVSAQEQATCTKTYYQLPISSVGFDDEGYEVWNDSTVYQAGDYVFCPDTFVVYRCTGTDNSNMPPPLNPDKWAKYGAKNEYKYLETDENIGDQSTGTDVILEFDFSRLTTIAGVNLDFTSCLLELIDNNTSEIVVSELIQSVDIGCVDFAEYFYEPVAYREKFINATLPYLPLATLKLTFTGAVKIGSLLMGRSKNMGLTLLGATSKIRSTAKIQIDEYTGFPKILRYGTIEEFDADVIFDRGEYNMRKINMRKIINKNILWIPTTEEDLSEMVTIGYIEDIEFPIENNVKIKTSMKIIGVI